MATLNGMISFSGKLGDLVFYNRGKTKVVRQQVKSYQLSENSKKSGRDFGAASRTAAYIRAAFLPLVERYADGDLVNRLNKRVMEIFKGISKEHAGNKKLIDGNLGLLRGFEFNVAAPLSKLLFQPLGAKIQSDGILELEFPKTKLEQFVRVIPNASCAVLQVMVFNFELDGEHCELIKVNDMEIPLNLTDFQGAKLTLKTTQKGARALIIALGISYLSNGIPNNDKRYFGCQISHAWHLQDGVEVEFITLMEDKIEVFENVGGISWEMG